MPLLAAAAALCSAGIDPAYKTQLTIYHLNPLSAGALPVNMDTGDAAGDLSFYLDQFLLPLECADPDAAWSGAFDCKNPERVSDDLVITKVVTDVDSRYTTYSACNLCNGTDPMSGRPCKVGSYVCDCENHHRNTTRCDPAKVGIERADTFGPVGPTPPPPPQPATPPPPKEPCACSGEYPYCWSNGCYGNSSCFDDYCYKSDDSTEKSADVCPGRCTDNYMPPKQCSAALQHWCGRYQSSSKYCSSCTKDNADKLSSASCSDVDTNSFCATGTTYEHCSPGSDDWICWNQNIRRKAGGLWYSTLAEGQCNATGLPCSWEARSVHTIRDKCLKMKLVDAVEKEGPDCFGGCGARNMNSTCWIGCFMDTLLGAGARNSTTAELSGMDFTHLTAAWENAFLPEEQGGCPIVPGTHNGDL